jgi:hypothetical protein
MYRLAHEGGMPSAVPAIAGLDAALPPFIAGRYYTVKEVAILWNLSQSKVRELFAEEAGVMRIGKATRKVGSRRRRGYFTTRLSESTVLRLHRRLTGAGWYAKLATEQHYTPQQLAAAYGLSDTMVRRMFAEEGGVLRVGQGSRRVGKKLTRRMYTLRIPETVAQRAYDQRVNKPCPATP